HCHWPTRFVGDRLRIITHYDANETNTEKKTVLLLHVGGQQGLGSQGIHWHVDRGIHIRYLSDPTRENIRVVELRREDATIKAFKAPEGGSGEPAAADGRTAGDGTATGANGASGEAAATPDGTVRATESTAEGTARGPDSEPRGDDEGDATLAWR